MTTLIQLISVGLISVACILSTGDALTCMRCNNVVNISECISNVIQCGPGEQCFLEEVTTDSLQVVFKGGCRSDDVCRVMASIAVVGKRYLHRPQRNLVTCASCCNDSPDADGPCNAKLCGQKAPPKPRTCLYCSNKASSIACSNRVICSDTQVCANEMAVLLGTLVRYSFYCEEKHVCHEAYLKSEQLTGRKRKSISSFISGAEAICSSCCIGIDCNRMDCYDNMRRFNSSDFT